MRTHAPDLDREAPDALDDAERAVVEAALRARYPALAFRVEARSGSAAAAWCAVVDEQDGRRAHEMFVFARGEGARERALDYLDGVVAELAEDRDLRSLPLDWEGRPFDGDVVFVRGEVRDYAAEEEAARLLGEDAPKRGLAR